MTESLSKVEESLECPVCYKIPRDLPIPCCEAGHIVCQDCRRRVTHCPTCRGKLQSNTSSLAGSLIMLVEHKCRFSFFGCEVKTKLEDIVDHEKICLERTVLCPLNECKNEIQIKKYDEHSIHSKCAYVPDDTDLMVGEENDDKDALLCERFHELLEEVEDIMFFQFADEDFKVYFNFSYVASKQSFVVRTFLPDCVETASKYTARVTISPYSSRNLIYRGPVLSIEDLPDVNSSQAYNKYWFISKDVLYHFISNEEEYKNKILRIVEFKFEVFENK